MNLWYLGLGFLGAGFGAGLVLLAAAGGIGRLASAALEGTARQPEAAANLRLTMIIAGALIEGLGLFALVICFMMANALNGGLPSSSKAASAAEAPAAH